MNIDELLVFDTGPLCHFAQENWLGVLKAVVGKRTAVIPDVVAEELRIGAARDRRIHAVLDATWIGLRELRTDEEITAFTRFSTLLVRGDHNLGEAAVLALASTCGGTAVVDDGAARRAARQHRVAMKPTLALLCEAVRSGLLTIELASACADDLVTGQYRVPFRPGEFEKWARENLLLS